MIIYGVNPDVKIATAKTVQGAINVLLRMQRAGHKFAFMEGKIVGVSGSFSSDVGIDDAVRRLRQRRKELTT